MGCVCFEFDSEEKMVKTARTSACKKKFWKISKTAKKQAGCGACGDEGKKKKTSTSSGISGCSGTFFLWLFALPLIRNVRKTSISKNRVSPIPDSPESTSAVPLPICDISIFLAKDSPKTPSATSQSSIGSPRSLLQRIFSPRSYRVTPSPEQNQQMQPNSPTPVDMFLVKTSSSKSIDMCTPVSKFGDRPPSVTDTRISSDHRVCHCGTLDHEALYAEIARIIDELLASAISKYKKELQMLADQELKQPSLSD